MLLAKTFFEFHAQVQKCHFGNFSFLPKWHFWTRTWNSKIFLAISFFWSIMKMAIRNCFRNMSQGLPNPGFMQEKVQKGDFLCSPMMKKFSTHFSDSTHQECRIFARIGHGPCYHHWNEIFAGVICDYLTQYRAFIVLIQPLLEARTKKRYTILLVFLEYGRTWYFAFEIYWPLIPRSLATSKGFLGIFLTFPRNSTILWIIPHRRAIRKKGGWW